MTERKRTRHGQPVNLRSRLLEFLNPYPWMSDVEAMVHLELERRRIPFSWRWFDGDAVNLRYYLPDFHPEFTLAEHKLVIVVLGGFFGTLPDVLDRTALAEVALAADGWKLITLFDHEIRAQGARRLLDGIRELNPQKAVGPPRVPPYGPGNLMERLRRHLSGLALLRMKFLKGTATKENTEDGRDRVPSRRLLDRDRRRRIPRVVSSGPVARRRDAR